MMKLIPWPDHIENTLLAKSADKGEGGKPESLAQHTAYVLMRLAEFIKLRPNLPSQVGQPNLWHCLYWATFLHDFGKAMPGFQEILKKDGDDDLKEMWRGQRHEVFSLAFLDWIEGGMVDREKLLTAAAIVSHHRDASSIRELYPLSTQKYLGDHFIHLSTEHVEGLHVWLADSGWQWAQQLELNRFGVRPVNVISTPQHPFADQAVQRIRYWLKRYRNFFKQLEQEHKTGELIPLLALRGMLINSDHSASAHANELPSVRFSADDVLISRNIKYEQLHAHQSNSEVAIGSVLLIAPTGSGKTEAALLWAAGQVEMGYPAARLFYTLPYQASMNAMEKRLKETFDLHRLELVKSDPAKTLVGLQHGRALLTLYQQMMERQEGTVDKKTATKQARWLKNLSKLNYPPVRVFSPYQMLKAMYRLKGYEAQLTDYHNGLFIFDEIHAYEVNRLALILKTIEYLRRYYNARFFIMSATFPKLIKKWLRDALGECNIVEADPNLFKEFQRHRLQVLDGELLENLQLVEIDARAGRSVLVVCNLVDNAQQTHAEISRRLCDTDVEVMLLHGRFNLRDRSKKEKRIEKFTGAKSKHRKPIVLIATQVVEVSLDIDLDTIYSEPAPLEALIQRFGRINRARAIEGLATVHVFNQPQDGQAIYDERLIQGTLAILSRENGRPIDEGKIGQWLDEIYQGEVAEDWQAEFDKISQEFEKAVIQTLRPFSSDSVLQEEFSKMFDGIDVLPQDLHNEYYDLLENRDFIAARQLLVSISWKRFHVLRNAENPKIQWDDDIKLNVVKVAYNSDEGLDFSQN